MASGMEEDGRSPPGRRRHEVGCRVPVRRCRERLFRIWAGRCCRPQMVATAILPITGPGTSGPSPQAAHVAIGLLAGYLIRRVT